MCQVSDWQEKTVAIIAVAVVIEGAQYVFIEGMRMEGPESDKLQACSVSVEKSNLQKGSDSLDGPMWGRMFNVTVKSVHLIW